MLALTVLLLDLDHEPPAPEWGSMVNDGRTYFQTHPWIIVTPGRAVALAVLAVSLLGDGLRDLPDPYTHH